MKICASIICIVSLVIISLGCNNDKLKAGEAFKKMTFDTTVSAVSMKNGLCRIDSSIIEGNRNLAGMIYDLTEGSLNIVTSKEAIPPAVMQFLEEVSKAKVLFADANEQWESTDTLDSLSGPNKKLEFVGNWNNKVCLAFISGGVGIGNNVMLFKLSNGQVVDFWHGYPGKRIDSENELIDFLRAERDHRTRNS